MSPFLEEATNLQRQVQSLLGQELHESAEIVGSFLICRTKGLASELPVSGPGSHSQSLEMYGDALYKKKEYRRALRYYREAEQYRKSGSLTRTRQSSTTVASSSAPDTVVDADLKFKECKCFIRLDEVNNALRSLVAVAPKQRSPAMHMALGSLYKSTGLTRDAINSYKSGLKQNPLAVEAIIALSELGVSGSEIWNLIVKSFFSQPSPTSDGSGKGSGTSPTVSLKDVAWLEQFVGAHASSHGQKTSDAIHKFGELEKYFRNNMHCLLYKAKLQVDMDSLVEAQTTFNRARETDPDNLDMMDYFAVLLRHKGTCGSLNSLAHRLMMIDQRRPEPWIAVSLYSDMRGDRDKALSLVEQALQSSPNHVLGYHIKGTLLLSMGRADHAMQAFMAANKLQKDIHSFKGLVDSFLALRKLKEALATAKEALAIMKSNPKAITLVGRVLAQLPDGGHDKAKKAFLRALNIDPLSVDAALALADLYISSAEYDKCAELLRESLKHHNYDFLHTKIAEVYTLNEQYDEALTYYHTAISMNPNSSAAAAGLERLEKLMRGVDPDAEEDDADMDDGVASSLT